MKIYIKDADILKLLEGKSVKNVLKQKADHPVYQGKKHYTIDNEIEIIPVLNKPLPFFKENDLKELEL